MNNGGLDLLQRELDEADRGPARLVENVHEQFELGLAVDATVMRDAVDQPVRVVGGQVALRPLLKDDVVGDGFDEKVGPVGRALTARVIEIEKKLGLFRSDDAVFVKYLPQGA